jgi:hypothetical protein
VIDFRTHAVTLVAVFVAMALGLLLGAARGGPVLARWQSAAIVRIERQFAEEQGALTSARASLAMLRADQASAEAFARAALPWIAAGRLRGRSVVLYADSDALSRQVAAALAMAGAAVRTGALDAPAAGPEAVVLAGQPGDAAAVAALLGRLRDAGIPAVGAESMSTAPAADATFTRLGLSFVDDVDEPAGQAALVLLLAGSRGHYGREPTAAGPLPAPGR